MKNFKYKVGDRVIATDNINLNKKRPGTIVTLWYTADHPSPYGVKFDDWGDSNDDFLWSAVHSLIPTQKIVITTDGKTTLARLYEDGKVVKSAEAKCCPEDTFNFKVGAEIAFNRLIGKPMREPTSEGKHQYKPGDKVKVVKNTCYHFSEIGDVITLTRNFDTELGRWYYEEEGGFISEDDFEPYVEPEKKNLKFNTGDYAKVVNNVMYHGLAIGTIVKLTKDDDCYIAVAEDSPTEWYVCDDELEPYTKPKGYNGKVVCVGNSYDPDSFTLGKVYEIKDGKFTDNNGKVRPCTDDRVKYIEDLNKGYFKTWSYHFIPFVED